MDSSDEKDTKKEIIINKQNKSESVLHNVKSKFILKKIFNHLLKRINLEIIKYNKKLQNIFTFSIKDYKEFHSLFSPIELEITINENNIGEFINILNEEDKKYFHIYFNNNNSEEIKRYKLNNKDKVKTIKIIIDYQMKSFNNLFESCTIIKSIHFKKFFRNNINNMSNMFSKCTQLKKIIFSNFNTTNVTDMNNMFSFCFSLEEINLSNFNTSNVTDMSFMFSQCTSLYVF